MTYNNPFRKLPLLTLCALVALCRAGGPGFSLVTAPEYRSLQAGAQSSQAPPGFSREAFEFKALELDAPRILIDSPDTSTGIHPPLRLELRFQPAPDAQIDVSSFQVIYKYGLIHKDITDRIRPFVTLTAAGVSGASAAAIPAGEHTLIIRIRDTHKRLGEQSITFRIDAG